MSKVSFLVNLSIENFPSRMELLDFINQCIEEEGYNKGYKKINMDNKLVIVLKDIEIAYEIIKRIQKENKRNNLYSKVTAQIEIIGTPDLDKVILEERNKTHKFVYYWQPQDRSKFTRKEDPISVYMGGHVDKREIEREEYYKNKALWLNKKGFQNRVGIASSKKNEPQFSSVFVGPECDEKFEFRPNEKEKWASNLPFCP